MRNNKKTITNLVFICLLAVIMMANTVYIPEDIVKAALNTKEEFVVDKDLLKLAIDKLNKREKEIMNLRFGIDGLEKEKTQKEVASLLGISQSYISRLEKKIMKKMKKEIVSKTG